jgi:protein TonB
MANAQHVRPSGAGEEVNLEIDDTQSARILGEAEAHQTPILVLSRDAALVDTVRKATPRGGAVTTAPDLDHVADRLPSLRPGVLVVDTASTADVAALVAQLTQHFPELVVVVAGKREDSTALMQLTAAGRIFRFLLTPLSHGQTRLALEAAITQHLDLTAAAHRQSAGGASDGGSKNYVVTYGALAAGLLIVIGGIWFGIKHFTSKPEMPVQTATTTTATPTSGVPEKPDPVQAELALAKEAFDQGKYLEPAGESALDYYRSALAIDANSQAAKDGIRDVMDKILSRAEAALTAEKLEEAIRTIETARSIDPTYPRLAFLDTQVARERERLKLTVAAETGARVRTLVAQAAERMDNGRLITPSGGSARDALLEARKLDPTDPTVAQGIRDLSNLVTEEARKSLAAGKIDEAQAYATAARGLGSAGAALAAVERSLSEATRSANAARTPAKSSGPNTDSLVTEVRQRMADGKLIDPPGASAKDSLNQLIAQTPNRPETEELAKALSTRLLNSGKQATAAKAYDRAAQLIAAAREIGAKYNEAAIAQAESDLSAARDQSSQLTNIVSAASLKRTRTVNPQYPEAARKKGIEGWVELAFTVTLSGSVEDIEVRNSSPADVFDDAAKRAVRQWRFEPVVRNGQIVPQRAMVRLRFTQQGQ